MLALHALRSKIHEATLAFQYEKILINVCLLWSSNRAKETSFKDLNLSDIFKIWEREYHLQKYKKVLSCICLADIVNAYAQKVHDDTIKHIKLLESSVATVDGWW